MKLLFLQHLVSKAATKKIQFLQELVSKADTKQNSYSWYWF